MKALFIPRSSYIPSCCVKQTFVVLYYHNLCDNRNMYKMWCKLRSLYKFVTFKKINQEVCDLISFFIIYAFLANTVKPLISMAPISTDSIFHGQESFPNPKSPLCGAGTRPVFTPVNLIEQCSGVSI